MGQVGSARAACPRGRRRAKEWLWNLPSAGAA
jgi:hypothetical protein